MVDTGYCIHAEQTLALVEAALQGAPLQRIVNTHLHSDHCGGNALLRGEVIGPGSPVIAGSTLTAVYITNPSPFDNSLTKFVSESPATVFAYLVPITATEAALVREHGWRWFEDQLEEQNPDIWDLERSDVIRQ